MLGGFFTLVFAGCSKNGTTETSTTEETAVELQGRPGGPSVRGMGGMVSPLGERRFNIQADVDNNGNVSGKGYIHFTGGGDMTKFDVTCLVVLADNKTAHMNGVVTESDTFAPGTLCKVTVYDDGEGSNAQDRMTLVALYPGALTIPPCNVPSGLGLNNVIQGNIQVRN